MKVTGYVRKGSGWTLLISILISVGVGLLSSMLSMGTMEKYQCLIQPSFSPPAWIFPLVWSILYLFMGIASYRVYSVGIEKDCVQSAIFYYALQLIFNFFWTILFFRFDLRGFAFIWILALLLLILITTIKFYKIDKTLGYLMIPYLLWVTFASVLNYAIWQLNR